MTDLVDPTKIERIVGAARQDDAHLGRAVSSEQQVYILHSGQCRASGRDLRACEYSLALDEGIDEDDWCDAEDVPVVLGVRDGLLIPLARLQ